MSTLVLDRTDNAAGRRTLAENLRHQLADEIMTGVLAPGVALDETEIARRFGVSGIAEKASRKRGGDV